jgi:putative ABC transport system substrate-binding protein
MIIKLIIIVTLLPILAPVRLLEAQQPARVPRILLTRPDPTGAHVGQVLIEAFRQALRERGYREGENVALEALWMAGEPGRIAARITDATQPKVDFIVTSGTNSTRAAQKATNKIPIIMATGSADPVAEGFAASYARPGGNITGLTNMSADLSGKRLELLKEAAPKSSRVALLLDPTRSRAAELKETEDAAQVIGVKVLPFVTRRGEDYAATFRAVQKQRADALMVVAGGVFNVNRHRLAELAAKNRLPAMYTEHEYANAGGLMVYASTLTEHYRRAAVFVDKIIKGAKPGDLPIEPPTKFELIFNLKAAKQIGLTIPPNLLVRADKVIR